METENRPRALVVEDHPDVADLERHLLERAGYDVTVTGGADSAVTELQRAEPDVIILDLRLGAADGLNLLSYVRRRYGVGLPVLIVTGHVDAQTVDYVTQLGNVNVLSKVNISDLVNAVESLCRSAAGTAGVELTGSSRALARPEG